MELRALRYFLAVAETRHFGRAAEMLYISQPSVSHTIKALESELGVELFVRTAKGAELTDPGRVLLPSAQATVRAANDVARVAEGLRSGVRGRLRIGFEASGAGRISTLARMTFAQRFPDVALEMHRYDWGSESQALREHEVDVAFVWLPANLRGLDATVIAREQRYCLMHEDHRLAARTELSIMDLVDEPIMRGSKAPREWDDWWTVNPRPDGSEPRWSRTNDNVEELLEHVGEGAAIAIVCSSIATMFARPGIVAVPIMDIEPLTIVIAHLEGETSPVVDAFVEIVKEIAAAPTT